MVNSNRFLNIYIILYVNLNSICIIDQINLDGTLQRDSVSPSGDISPAWDIMDIMNNVKVVHIFIDKD